MLVDCAWHWLLTQQVEQLDGPQVMPASVLPPPPTGVQNPEEQISSPPQVRQAAPLFPQAVTCSPERQVPSSSQQPLQVEALQLFVGPHAGVSAANRPIAIPGMIQRHDVIGCPSSVPGACRPARQARERWPLSGGAGFGTTGLACRPPNR